MKIKALLRNFRNDNGGTVAILFGISVIVLAGIVGLAIDSSRLYNVRAKMNEAVDAAALAAAKLFDKQGATDAEFQAIAEAYVNAYMNRQHIDRASWSNVRTDVDPTAGAVTVTADVKLVSLFGGISAGIDAFSFSPTSRVVYKPRTVEIALVLDITGSMCDVVPAPPAEACASGTKIGGLKAAARAMVDALAAAAAHRGTVRVSLIPYSASVNAGAYANLASGGRSVDGCVVERTGGSAYDDASPFGAPVDVSTVAENPSYSCPSAPVLPLTDISDSAGRDTVNAAIDSLKGFGGTAGHIGTAWGWYTLSPQWAGVWPGQSAPSAYDKDRTVKVLVVMTDGMFNTAYRNGGQSYVWPDTATEDKTKPGTSGNQALRICDNVRRLDGDIELYTVGFQTPPQAEELLKECAGEANFMAADKPASPPPTTITR